MSDRRLYWLGVEAVACVRLGFGEHLELSAVSVTELGGSMDSSTPKRPYFPGTSTITLHVTKSCR